MRLSLISRFLLSISLTPFAVFASPLAVYTFTGEQQPFNPANGDSNQGPSDFLGANCTPGSNGPNGGACVLGSPVFNITSATLTQNTATNWTLTVVTNAPSPGSGSLEGFSPLAFGDALIQYGVDSKGNPVDYGIALGSQTSSSAPDSTEVAGGLYMVDQFSGQNNYNYPAAYLTASQAGYTGGRASEPVWINANNMSLVSADQGASNAPIFSVTCWNGTTYVSAPAPLCNSQFSGYNLYTISDTFNAPAGFLSSGPFSFEVASYVCANGLIIASTPEPRALFLIVIPVMFLLGRRLSRSRGVQVIS